VSVVQGGKTQAKSKFPADFNNDKSMMGNIESSTIPSDLPPNTKKFIEVKSEEVIYLTPEGKIYTEDKNSKLIELKDLTSMKPKSDKPASIQKIFHEKNKASLSESLSAPTLNGNERNKSEQMGACEAFLNPFANQMSSQIPFGMSPSMAHTNFMGCEMFTNSYMQNNPLYSLTGTPNYASNRRMDRHTFNQYN